MFHNSQAVLALSKDENPTVFQKTLGLNDFYFGDGTASTTRSATSRWSASRRPTMYRGEKPLQTQLAPQWSLEDIARHAVDFWLSTEDLPRRREPGDAAPATAAIQLTYAPTNEVPKQRLLPPSSRRMLGRISGCTTTTSSRGTPT